MNSADGYHIRKYEQRDRSAVRAICNATGNFGEPVAPLYDEPESFADMFTGYYTDCEPENAWVCVRASDEKVVGYFLGSVDARRAWNPAVVALKHMLTRGILFKPGIARFFWRVFWETIRGRKSRRPPFDIKHYPAHFHINFLREARGLNQYLMMHQAWVEHLLALGVKGIHGDVFYENNRAMMLAEKTGYVRHGEPYLIPGMRDSQGRRLHGQLHLLDLSPPKRPAEALVQER